MHAYFFLTLLFIFVLLAQAVQAAHIDEEWVDHAHSKLKDEEGHRVLAVKILAAAEKKFKDLSTKLTELEREKKSMEAALVRLRGRPKSSASIFGRPRSS